MQGLLHQPGLVPLSCLPQTTPSPPVSNVGSNVGGNVGGGGTTRSIGSCSVTIEGRRWYYRLVKTDNTWCLFDEHPINTLDGWLVVCLVVPSESLRRWDRGNDTSEEAKKRKPTTRLYSAFRSYLEFYDYQQHFSPLKRSFFEIILGEFAQKPHFDIDVDLIALAPKESPGDSLADLGRSGAQPEEGKETGGDSVEQLAA